MSMDPSPVDTLNSYTEPGTAVSRAELSALTSGALLAPWPGVGRLTVTGADRLDFIHGQLANDVKGLSEGGCNRSLLLNHKGHALALVQVLRDEGRLDLFVEGNALDVVSESLRRHIIFDQVTLTGSPVASFTVQGPRASDVVAEVVGTAPAVGRFARVETELGEAWIVPARRSAAGGFDLHVSGEVPSGPAPLASFEAALTKAGALRGSTAAVELARICAGLADVEHEGGEGVLPQEAGLDSFLSYRKGCYLGQEIMARVEARGSLRRRLGALRLTGLPPGGERDVRFEGKTVGRLGGVALHPEHGPVALAVLRSDLPVGAILDVAGLSASEIELPLPVVGR